MGDAGRGAPSRAWPRSSRASTPTHRRPTSAAPASRTAAAACSCGRCCCSSAVCSWCILFIVPRLRLEAAAPGRVRADGDQLHLTYSEEDPFGLLGYPFGLFHKGDGRGIEHVLHGAWQEVDVVAFDYWYYDESTDSKGGTSRTYHRFDCALLPMPADCPRLTHRPGEPVHAAGRCAQLPRHPVRVRGVQPRLHGHCEEPKFANDLIDARMMQWLQATGSGARLRGARATASWSPGPRSTRRPSPSSWASREAFVQHVPKVVPSLYPG